MLDAAQPMTDDATVTALIATAAGSAVPAFLGAHMRHLPMPNEIGMSRSMK
jgi:hypothetical protein